MGTTRWVVTVAVGGLTLTGTYLGLVTGAAPLDLRVGRRTRALGPLGVDVAAPAEVVFDVIAAPYAERAPRAWREKVLERGADMVLERGAGMVLAAHVTSLRGH